MAPRGQRPKRPADIKALLAIMDDWPQSWAGDDEDLPLGRHITKVLHPFIEHLQREGVSPKTLRRHLDNLWLIGGEIIRSLNGERTPHTKSPTELLLDAIAGDEAPLIDDLTEAEQTALDATARKLCRFLLAHKRRFRFQCG